MKLHLMLFLLLGMVLISACAPAGETEGERAAALQADLDALEQIRVDYEKLFNAQDAAGLTTLYTNDAVLSEPSQAPRVGSSAIQAGLQATFDRYDVDVSIGVDEIQAAGDWAFAAGTATNTVSPKEGDGEMELRSSHLVIFKRQTGGSWKISRLVVSSDIPPPGAQEGM